MLSVIRRGRRLTRRCSGDRLPRFARRAAPRRQDVRQKGARWRRLVRRQRGQRRRRTVQTRLRRARPASRPRIATKRHLSDGSDHDVQEPVACRSVFTEYPATCRCARTDLRGSARISRHLGASMTSATVTMRGRFRRSRRHAYLRLGWIVATRGQIQYYVKPSSFDAFASGLSSRYPVPLRASRALIEGFRVMRGADACASSACDRDGKVLRFPISGPRMVDMSITIEEHSKDRRWQIR